MYQVYLVENDIHLNNLFSSYMQKEGWTITSFLEGENAYKYIDKCPHIWVINSNPPNVDGYQILNEIKERYPQIPVMLTSERNSGMDRVIGLEMGCEDYLYKPFLPKELVIRTRKILDRIYGNRLASYRATVYEIPPYTIDETKRLVFENDNMVNLTSKELDLLILFVKNPLRTFSREQVLRYIWDGEHFGSERSVDDLVRRLRKKMRFLRIESIYGYGYRFLRIHSLNK
ncbi:MAG: response regulator transcription factor [Bacillota bacterium]